MINSTEHNDATPNDTQHNATGHNYTQHNYTAKQYKYTLLSKAVKPRRHSGLAYLALAVLAKTNAMATEVVFLPWFLGHYETSKANLIKSRHVS